MASSISSDTAKAVYRAIFHMKDGSTVWSSGARAIDTMVLNVGKLLSASSDSIAHTPPDQWLGYVRRNATDSELWRVLFLAVAGDFTVYQEDKTFPQQCALVADPVNGDLSFYDPDNVRSVILEVLVVVCLLCLVRGWSKMMQCKGDKK